MKKKIVEMSDEEISQPEVEEIETQEVSKVAPLTTEFGRQDLNEMRDKVNEIIAKL